MIDENAKLWNGPAGRAWVESQDLLNQLSKPIENLLAEAVNVMPGSRLLDVGCGTGSTTRAATRRLRCKDCCVGIDVSELMIKAARLGAEQEGTAITFVCADAQTYPFEPMEFDIIISRFGVMFFADSVQAFRNLRRSARAQAELRFVVWRSAEENPFMTEAERAAAPLLPETLPLRKANAPGQFALSDPRAVYSMLEQSNWKEIEIFPLDVPCSLPEEELTCYLTHFGPVGRALQDTDPQTRAKVIQAVRPAFDRYIYGSEVRFTAACWMIRARASSAQK